jgi:hypothetical protein
MFNSREQPENVTVSRWVRFLSHRLVFCPSRSSALQRVQHRSCQDREPKLPPLTITRGNFKFSQAGNLGRSAFQKQ